MKQIAIFTNQSDAIKFAEQNCTQRKDHYVETARKGLSSLERENFSKYAHLEVDGYSRLVAVWVFIPSAEGYYVLRDPFVALEVIGYGAFLVPFETRYKSSKFGFARVCVNGGRLNGFEFDKPMPKYVGIGSKNKIQAWVDWLCEKEEAEKDFLAQKIAKNKAFRDKVAEFYPYARMNVCSDGWMSECWIERGGVTYHFLACDNGEFVIEYSVNRKALLTMEQLFANHEN